MNFVKFKKFNQGDMKGNVSNYRLAKVVASQKAKKTAGTVSDNALNVVYVLARQLGLMNISFWSDKNVRTIP